MRPGYPPARSRSPGPGLPGSGLLAWGLFAALLMAFPQSAWAGDEVRTSADVDVTGGYSKNPFSEAIGDPGSADVEINARPKVRLLNEHSVLSLDGLIDYEHYFHLYSDKTDYRGTLDYVLTPSSRLALHANAYYDSSIIGGLEAIAPVDVSQPQPPPTTGTDLGLFGSQQRRRSFNAAGDVSYSLSSLSSLTANVFYNSVRYGGSSTQFNYDGYGGGAGYSRRFSEHLQLGVQGSVARYVYQGALGDTQTYSLQATFNYTFSDRWKASGALGGTYSDRTIGGKSTTPSGNFLLCRTTTRTTACLTASRAVLPTGSTGTVTTNTIGGNYSYRLSEHSSVSAAANYSHNNQPAFILSPVGGAGGAVGVGQNPLLATSYFSASATFDRTLKERVHMLATARYRTLSGGIANRPNDYGGSLGVSVKLGDYR